MTTTQLIRKGFDDFPSVFSRQWLDEIFPSNFDVFYQSPRATFPYDIVDHVDDDGKTTATELIFAVGGITKDEIKLKITGNTLSVNIDKSQQDDPKKIIRHKGISRRSMSIDYGLHNVDKDKITSSLKDGELKIILPKQIPQEVLIDIKD
jgi:HSP20 family molecular chaperone IbpA